MITYDLNDLAVIYDTLEFLNQNYGLTIRGIVGAKDVNDVKNTINKSIEALLQTKTDEKEIQKIRKYILK